MEGATTAAIFEAYPSKKCSPRAYTARAGGCGHGQLHGSQGRKAQRELVEQQGCKLLCTCRPTLSSELNPIEEAFSKMKGILSARSGARSWEVLIAALGRALDEITPGRLGGFSSTADSESMGSTVVISAIGVLECSTRTAQPYSGEPIRLWILGLIALILG